MFVPKTIDSNYNPDKKINHIGFPSYINVELALFGIAFCMVWALWGLFSSTTLIIWLIGIFLITASHAYLRISKTAQSLFERDAWDTYLHFVLLILWAWLALFFWPAESLAIQIIITLGLCLMAVLTRLFKSSLTIYLNYLIPCLAILRLFLEENSLATITAVILFIFIFLAVLIEQYIEQLILMNIERKRQIKSVLEEKLPSNNQDIKLKKSREGNKNTQSHSIPNKRVLVVEDNIINQQVVMELLQELDVQVRLANNGKQALELIVKESFDLLLMDIQMPEMDGYQATQQIRQLKQFKDLPIVAMTAYAMQQDRSRCLAAGMNDHVAKPFEPETFYQTVCVWLKLPQYNLQETPKFTSDIKNDCLPSLPGIELETGLKKVLNNKALYLKLLSEFYDDFCLLLEQLEQHLDEAQNVLAARLLHRLKGASGNIGAMQLYSSSKNLELAIISHHTYSDELADFKKIYTKVMSGLAELPRQKQGKFQHQPLGNIDFVALKPLLVELAEYVHDASPQAVDLLPNIRTAARGNLNELFGALTEHIYTFQFEEAEVTLKRINHKLKQMDNVIGK